jgi:hypothetical protein
MSRDIPNHKHHLASAGQAHYIDQTTILSTHPFVMSKPDQPDNKGNHPAYDAALIMVGERHAKGDLSDLVGHLLVKIGESRTVPAVMQALKTAMQADSGYAWGWHCNIAMAFYDAAGNTPNRHRIGNEGAARFMRTAFDVDVTQFVEYQALVKGWALMEAHLAATEGKGDA